jgi:beta-lactamase superfamily II metal-dependent hydrolase
MIDIMEYDVNIIDVGDADAIVINCNLEGSWWTVVIDAGNVGDGSKIKPFIKSINNGKYCIDYAVCTHPDKDHKGGFFDLYADNDVMIRTFIALDPSVPVSIDYRRLLYKTGELERKAHDVYNHPQDSSKNLIDIAKRNSLFTGVFAPGLQLSPLPIYVVGPSKEFYKDAAYEMALNFAELTDESNSELYSEDEIPSDEDAKGVLDEMKENSPTNKASLILLFKPEDDQKYLLTGDACAKSIHDAIDTFGDVMKKCNLKVPHHGSKHNLTTEVIDLLQPVNAVISCKGTKKHPSSSVVYWLSKYCDVYSTSKSGTLTYQSAPVTHPATPLKKKIQQ